MSNLCDFLQQTENYIQKHNLIDAGDNILVAVSGGIDSVVLTHVLNRLGCNVSIAHCNFSLRGEESNQDEMFVRQLAESLKIKCFVKCFDTHKYADEQKISTQMAARDLRYGWFREVAEKNDFSKIALAHHADDQIETFFINLLRGSGISGLKGMKPKNENLIRPLLFASRKMISDYAFENQIAWREDRTNAETKYLRNKIRHQLIPLFEEINPNAKNTIGSSLNFLSSEYACYQNLVEEKMNQIVQKTNSRAIVEKECFCNDLNGKQLLFEWIRRYGFNTSQLDSIFDGLKNSSGTHFYSETHILAIERNTIEISAISDSDFSEETLIDIQTNRIEKPINLIFKRINNESDFQINKKESVAQFDFDKLTFPLKLRYWQNGDRFYPIGMKGTKLVSDYFADKQFDSVQKQNTFLLVDSNNQIIWIVGHRMDNRFKITSDTKTIFQIELFQ